MKTSNGGLINRSSFGDKENVKNQQIENKSVELSSKKILELKIINENLEKERDFYFSKLRDIEILCESCTNQQENPFVEEVKKILFSMEEDDFE